MYTQNANTILMIEPVAFGFNAETAENNYFQHQDDTPATDIQRLAHQEFVAMTDLLKAKGITVITIKDTLASSTPDSIFPNNWISFHGGDRVAIYPMYAKNRRQERRSDILETLYLKDYKFSEIANYSSYEMEDRFLEGTGSMILDRKNRIAYASISERTDQELFQQFCLDFDYKAVTFSSFQWMQHLRLPIYHTNVMMSVADQYAVICLGSIDDNNERTLVQDNLIASGKEIIDISEEQMSHFAGNVLQVKNQENTPFLVMSGSAHKTLNQDQLERLELYNELIITPVPTIEKYGGGSVRCMMGEIF